MRGEASVVLIDVSTGGRRILPVQPNRIGTGLIQQCAGTLTGINAYSSPYLGLFSDSQIFLSAVNLMPGHGHTAPGAFVPTSVVSQWAYVPPAGAVPGYWHKTVSFDPPASTTEWRAVYVGRTTARQQILASLNFASPCTQTTTEVLQVTYRIYLDIPSDTPLDRLTYAHAQAKDIGKNSDIPPARLSTRVRFSPLVLPEGAAYSHKNTSANAGALVPSTDSYHPLDKVLRIAITAMSTSDRVGRLLGEILGGGDGPITGVNAVLAPSQSAIQNIYPRKDGGSNYLPYLDIPNTATGTGVVGGACSNEAWAGQTCMAVVYRIRITGSGDETTATYKVAKRHWGETLGAVGYWAETPVPNLPMCRGGSLSVTHHGGLAYPVEPNTLFLSPPTNRYPGMLPTAVDNTAQASDSYNTALHGPHVPGVIAYRLPEWIAYGASGLTIVNINGTAIDVDATALPAFGATNIGQVAFDSTGNIYVACRNTGLYKVNRSFGGAISSVQKLTAGAVDDDHCYGVCCKEGTNTIFALMGKELAHSTNGGSSFNIYNESSGTRYALTGFTNTGDDNRFVAVKVDPTHADDRLCIIANDAAATPDGKIWWWSRVGSSGGTSNAVRSTSATTFQNAAGFIRTGPMSFDYIVDGTGNNKWVFRGTTVNTAAPSNVTPGKGAACHYVWGSATNAGTMAHNASAYVANEPVISPYVLKMRSAGIDYLIGNDNGTYAAPVLRTIGQWGGAAYAQQLMVSNVSPAQGYTEYYTSAARGHMVHQGRAYIGQGIMVGFHPVKSTGATNTWGNEVSFASDSYYTLAWSYAVFTGTPTNKFGDGVGDIYTEFGWDGAQWVAGGAGSRALTSSHLLMDGITVNFGAGSYVAGEWYDMYVYRGVLKDDGTTFSGTVLQHSFEEVTVDVNTSVPSAGITRSNFPLLPSYAIGSTINAPITFATTEGAAVNLCAKNKTHQSFACANIVGAAGSVFGGGVLTGDFSVSFNVCGMYNSTAGLADSAMLMLVFDTVSYPFPTTFTPYTANPVPASNDFSIRLGDMMPTAVGSTQRTLDFFKGNVQQGSRVSYTGLQTNPGTDVITVTRTGGTIVTLYNGVPISTVTGVTTADMYFSAGWGLNGANNPRFALDNLKIVSGTDPRCMLTVSDTGKGLINDPYFSHCPAGQDRWNNSFTLNGVPATILRDQITAPSAGEIQLLRDGQVWFNAADAGKTFAGTYTYFRELGI